MRQILFRGLRTDGKGWVEGDLHNNPLRYGSQTQIYIADGDEEKKDAGWVDVDRKSIGQFNNIFKCFEGDLLHIGIDEFNLITNDKGEPIKYEVRFDGCEYTLYRVDLDLNWGRLSRLDEMGWCFEVTGNIHEGGKP
jgi:hypothetical protein